MEGLEGIGQRVSAYLADVIPTRLDELAIRLGVDPMAHPTGVLAQETGPLAVERWPLIYVLPRRMRRLEFAELTDDGTELYLGTYDVEVLAWVRADGYAATDQLRKRYGLAIREALLARRSLTGTVDEAVTAQLTTEPGTLVEDASDVFTGEAGATIAGISLRLDVTALEALAPTPGPLGTADTLSVAVEPLHPGLA